MADFCALCLSVDRNLFIINQELLEVLIPLLKASNFSIFKLTGKILKICWECRARLKGINTFRSMALYSLKHMINYWDSNLKDMHPKKSCSRLSSQIITEQIDVKEGDHNCVDVSNKVVKNEMVLDIEEMMMNTNNDPLADEGVDHKFDINSVIEPEYMERLNEDNPDIYDEVNINLYKRK